MFGLLSNEHVIWVFIQIHVIEHWTYLGPFTNTYYITRPPPPKQQRKKIFTKASEQKIQNLNLLLDNIMHGLKAWTLSFLKIMICCEFFTMRIKKILVMRKCYAHAVSSCIIVFRIVFLYMLHCNWEGGRLSNKIDSRSCNINLKTKTYSETFLTSSMGDRCFKVIIESWS